jgi:hypothetical protein
VRQLSILLVLCAVLAICEPLRGGAQVASASPSPSSAPQSPTPFLPFKYGDRRPVLYLLAIGGDAPTRQKFVASLAHELHRAVLHYGTLNETPMAHLVPMPDWGLSDYMSACSTVYSGYTPVSGALIVAITQSSAYTGSHFVIRINHNVITASLFYAGCNAKVPPSPTPAPTCPPPPARKGSEMSNATSRSEPSKLDCVYASLPTAGAPPPTNATEISRQYVRGRFNGKDIDRLVSSWNIPTPAPASQQPTPPPYFLIWNSPVRDADGQARFYTPLPLLAILMTLVSGYTALAVTHSSSSVNTTVFATPLPWQPVPRGGIVTTNSTTNGTGSNVATAYLSAIATSFLTSSLAYDTALFTTPTADRQTRDAADAIVRDLVYNSPDGMHCATPPPNEPDPDEITSTVGTTDTLESLPIKMPNATPTATANGTPPPDAMCLQILQAEDNNRAPIQPKPAR